jgi:hypothetical protein
MEEGSNIATTNDDEPEINMVNDLSMRITDSQHRFKQSSTAFLSITFIVFFAYSVIKFYKNRKNNFGLDVS